MGGEEPASKRARTMGAGGSAAASAAKGVPARPQPFMAEQAAPEAFIAGMDQVQAALVGESEQRERLQKPSRALRSHMENCIRELLAGGQPDLDGGKALLGEFLAAAATTPDGLRSAGFASDALAAVVGTGCLAHFLETGRLLPRKGFFDDMSTTEYLLGVIRFVDELEAYAVNRALWQDAASVGLASDLVKAILEAFMNFNFRNGQLRVRYDSIKYRVKRLENILYELSLVRGKDEDEPMLADDATDAEKAQASQLIDTAELDEMVKELDAATQDRENVIKATRDPQKDSKKAIFSLHRGNLDEARKLLQKTMENCRAIASSTTMSRGELHSGAYGNALEEYAEARIFEEWLTNDGNLLPLSVLQEEVDITEKDYLGGVVDFTGELGRYGVARATKRDMEGVKRVLASDLMVKRYAIQLQDVVSFKVSKKLNAVFTNTKKMENTLYELTLVMRSNRKTMDLSSTEADAPASGGGDADNN
mmetsp:Transcript_16954/g.42997  ORF Transcript_16954/g.42997 Transcript_16954/m.42997 type:complete len:480 (-) Transcript_16954:566-2005(-)